MLADKLGRVINSLRISVTDRCNFRCTYCMPATGMKFFPRAEILTFEEIVRFVRIASVLGISKLRLTGGEPLVRSSVDKLVSMLSEVEGIKDIAMTTNGLLLPYFAQSLYDAGLRRLNVSLDTLDPLKFEEISRRDGLSMVIEGLRVAREVGFSPIKVNIVAIHGITEDEILDFAALAREEDYEIRFIEFMPLDADGSWDRSKIIPGEEIRTKINTEFPLEAIRDNGSPSPATAYRFKDGKGKVGFINSVTEPFCDHCNRIRITADGKLRTCLFSVEETDFKPLLRGDATDGEIAEVLRKAVWEKEPGHRINEPDFIKPERTMSAIGG